MAIKDVNNSIGKDLPYFGDDAEIMKLLSAGVAAAETIRHNCIATKFDHTVVAIYKATNSKEGKRFDKFNALNTWFTAESGRPTLVHPAFFEFVPDIFKAGKEQQKEKSKKDKTVQS